MVSFLMGRHLNILSEKHKCQIQCVQDGNIYIILRNMQHCLFLQGTFFLGLGHFLNIVSKPNLYAQSKIKENPGTLDKDFPAVTVRWNTGRDYWLSPNWEFSGLASSCISSANLL